MQTMTVVAPVEQCPDFNCVHIAQLELETKYHQPEDLAMVEVTTSGGHVVKAEVLRYVGVGLRYKDLPMVGR